MEMIKKFGLMALAAVMCVSFVSCDDDDDKKGGKAEYTHSSAVFTSSHTGLLYDLVDVDIEVEALASYQKETVDGNTVITFSELAPGAEVNIIVTKTRNEEPINQDESAVYNSYESINFAVTRHFDDGTTASGGDHPFHNNKEGIRKDVLEEYITTFASGAQTYTYVLNDEGELVRE